MTAAQLPGNHRPGVVGSAFKVWVCVADPTAMGFSLRRSKKRDDLIVDPVTGAFNRRQLDAAIAAGFDVSEQPTATLLIEIDDLGRFGSKKGAGTENKVLERVSWVVMATVRTSDVVYRHDRSGFCVLLPATSQDDALAVADRVRANVEKMPLLIEKGVTVSIGVATGAANELRSTIERATEALGTGGPVGSNRVFVGADHGPAASSAVRTESFEPPQLSPKASAELASAFARTSDASIESSGLHSVVEPDASIPLTPPYL